MADDVIVTFRTIAELKLSTRALGVLWGLRVLSSQKDAVIDVREKLLALAADQKLSVFQVLARARNCGKQTVNQLCIAFAVPRPVRPKHCPTCRCFEHGE